MIENNQFSRRGVLGAIGGMAASGLAFAKGLVAAEVPAIPVMDYGPPQAISAVVDIAAAKTSRLAAYNFAGGLKITEVAKSVAQAFHWNAGNGMTRRYSQYGCTDLGVVTNFPDIDNYWPGYKRVRNVTADFGNPPARSFYSYDRVEDIHDHFLDQCGFLRVDSSAQQVELSEPIACQIVSIECHYYSDISLKARKSLALARLLESFDEYYAQRGQEEVLYLDGTIAELMLNAVRVRDGLRAVSLNANVAISGINIQGANSPTPLCDARVLSHVLYYTLPQGTNDEAGAETNQR